MWGICAFFWKISDNSFLLLIIICTFASQQPMKGTWGFLKSTLLRSRKRFGGLCTTSWKSVTRCFVDWLMKPRKFHYASQRQCRVRCHGYAERISRRVREGWQCLQRTLTGVSAILMRGYHSVRQLARFPRTSSAGEQKVDTHVFCCVVKRMRMKSLTWVS